MRAELYTYFSERIDPAINAVIFANQDGKRPAKPWATINVVSSSRPGMAAITDPDATGEARIEQTENLTVGVNVYGPSAESILNSLRDDFERPSAQSRLRELGFAFVRVAADVQDVSEVVGAGYEQRATLDVEMRALRSFVDDVGLIEKVELTANTESGETITETIDGGA